MLETKSPNEGWPWMVRFTMRTCSRSALIYQSFDPTDDIGKLE